MPFFVATEPRRLSPGRACVWATTFPSRAAATAHAQGLRASCVILEARTLEAAVEQARAMQQPARRRP
jgi:hypothetical protein